MLLGTSFSGKGQKQGSSKFCALLPSSDKSVLVKEKKKKKREKADKKIFGHGEGPIIRLEGCMLFVWTLHNGINELIYWWSGKSSIFVAIVGAFR